MSAPLVCLLSLNTPLRQFHSLSHSAHATETLFSLPLHSPDSTQQQSFDLILLVFSILHPKLLIIRDFQLISTIHLETLFSRHDHSHDARHEYIDAVHLKVVHVDNSSGHLIEKTHSQNRSLFVSHKNQWILLHLPQEQRKASFQILNRAEWKIPVTNERIALWCIHKHVYRLIYHDNQSYSMEIVSLSDPQSSHTAHKLSLKGLVLDFQCMTLRNSPGNKYLVFLVQHQGGWFQIQTLRRTDLQPGPWNVDNITNSPRNLLQHRYGGILIVSHNTLSHMDPQYSRIELNEKIIHVQHLTYKQRLDSRQTFQKLRYLLVLTEHSAHLVEMLQSHKEGTVWRDVHSVDIPTLGANVIHTSIMEHSEYDMTLYSECGHSDFLIRINLRQGTITIITNPRTQLSGSITHLSTQSFSNRNHILTCSGNPHSSFHQYLYCHNLERLTAFSSENVLLGQPKVFIVEYHPHSLVFLSHSHCTDVFFTKTMSPLNVPSIIKDQHSVLVASSTSNDYFIQVTQNEVILPSFTRATEFARWKMPSSARSANISLAANDRHDNLIVVSKDTLFYLKTENRIIKEIQRENYEHQASCVELHFHAKWKSFVVALGFWVENSVLLFDLKSMTELGRIEAGDNVRSIALLSRALYDSIHCIIGMSNGACIVCTAVPQAKSKILQIVTQNKIQVGNSPVSLCTFPFAARETVFVNSSHNMIFQHEEHIDKLKGKYVCSDVVMHSVKHLSTLQMGPCMVSVAQNESSNYLVFSRISDTEDIHEVENRVSPPNILQALSIESNSLHQSGITILLCKSSLLLCSGDVMEELDRFDVDDPKESFQFGSVLHLDWTPIRDEDIFQDEIIERKHTTIFVVQSSIERGSQPPLCLLRIFRVQNVTSPKLTFEDFIMIGEGNSSIPLMVCDRFLLLHLEHTLNFCCLTVDEKLGFKFSVNVVQRLEFRIPPGMQMGRLEIVDAFSAAAMHKDSSIVMIAASTERHGLVVWMFDDARDKMIQISCDALDRKEDEPYRGAAMCRSLKFVNRHLLLAGTCEGKIKLVALTPNTQEPFNMKFMDEDTVRETLDKYIIAKEQESRQSEQMDVLLPPLKDVGREFRMQLPLFSITDVAETAINGIVTDFVRCRGITQVLVGEEEETPSQCVSHLFVTSTGELGILGFVSKQHMHSVLKHFLHGKRTLDGNRMKELRIHVSHEEMDLLHKKYKLSQRELFGLCASTEYSMQM